MSKQAEAFLNKLRTFTAHLIRGVVRQVADFASTSYSERITIEWVLWNHLTRIARQEMLHLAILQGQELYETDEKETS